MLTENNNQDTPEIMKLFDTHFHYYPEDGEPEEYWERIKITELAYVLAAGADYDESCYARDFAAAVPHAWFAVGVHPHSADQYGDGIGMFQEFKGNEKLIAIGEIGLDYFYENSDRQSQWVIMENFLELALEWHLPAVVHCRDQENKDHAYYDAYRILRDFAKSGGRFDVHCFAGSPDWLEKFLELGAWVGVTGMVTFPKAENIREMLKFIPDNRLLLETDSPYLAPIPYRGQRNHPGYLIKVAEKVAAEKDITIEKCAKLTTANAFELFKL